MTGCDTTLGWRLEVRHRGAQRRKNAGFSLRPHFSFESRTCHDTKHRECFPIRGANGFPLPRTRGRESKLRGRLYETILFFDMLPKNKNSLTGSCLQKCSRLHGDAGNNVVHMRGQM